MYHKSCQYPNIQFPVDEDFTDVHCKDPMMLYKRPAESFTYANYQTNVSETFVEPRLGQPKIILGRILGHQIFLFIHLS